jgi:ribosomal protein L11 methyltransferase
MSWLQIHVTTTRERAPLVELLFEELDALSVTLGDAADQPLLEPQPGETPLWETVVATALFSGDQDSDRICAFLQERLPEPQLRVERLEDRTWERAWLDAFHPMRFGERLWVCPNGMPPDDPDAVVVELDPGLAFGTGTHPTTALCLQWLDGADLAGKQIIDFGCGSGILAIAALRLGAAEVIAIDHDPQALQATRDNAEKNGVLHRLRIHNSDNPPEVQADILLANILAGTLIALAPILAVRIRPGGEIVLSGILQGQWPQVVDAYQGEFRMDPPAMLDEWVRLTGQRC